MRATLLLVLLLASSATAQVNKWVDDKGKVHYGDRPPAGVKVQPVEARISSYTDEAVISRLDPATGKRSTLLQPGRVVMFTTAWCGVCKRAKAWLKRNGIRFEEYDVESDPNYHREFKALGGTGVPLILVGDQRMQGFSEKNLARLLRSPTE